jgi:hypothetical protein
MVVIDENDDSIADYIETSPRRIYVEKLKFKTTNSILH